MLKLIRSTSMGGWALTCAVLLAACAPAPSPATQPTAAPAPTAAKPVLSGAEGPAAVQPTAPPAAPVQAPQTQPAASAAWDQIVDSAKRERAITIVTGPGTGPQRFLERFKEKHPWLPVEHTGLRPSDFAPRVLSEQRNGLYAWDFLVGSGLNTAGIVLAPAGGLGNIKELLTDLPPEVKDDSKWAGGLEVYRDPQSPDSLITQLSVGGGFWVSRDQIPAAELNTIDQLLDPKFRGKIVVYDPTQASGGAQNLAPLLANRGEDFLERLFADQKMVIVENKRQATEWFMTGRYPIGFGMDEEVILEFQTQGVGKSAEQVLEPASTHLGAFGITLLKNPPHPNAAKVFLAWFLSHDGQDAWASLGTPTANSRRWDVPVYNPKSTPDFARLDEYKVWNGVPEGDGFVKRVGEIAERKR